MGHNCTLNALYAPAPAPRVTFLAAINGLFLLRHLLACSQTDYARHIEGDKLRVLPRCISAVAATRARGRRLPRAVGETLQDDGGDLV
jgi:hypothetical protein